MGSVLRTKDHGSPYRGRRPQTRASRWDDNLRLSSFGGIPNARAVSHYHPHGLGSTVCCPYSHGLAPLLAAGARLGRIVQRRVPSARTKKKQKKKYRYIYIYIY